MMFSRLIFLFVFFISVNAYAENYKLLDDRGLQGEELITVSVFPGNKNILFLGTNRGLYKKDLSGQSPWESVSSSFFQYGRVNHVVFNVSGDVGYVATQKGLYMIAPGALPQTEAIQNIFSRSDELENDCLSVCALADGTILVGTKAGLFTKKMTGDIWHKINSPFGENEITYLYEDGRNVYAADNTGAYKSENSGKSWKKIFEAYTNPESDDELEESSIKNIIGLPGPVPVLYIASTQGVFVTKNDGKSFDRLPIAGLNPAELKFVSVIPLTRQVFAVLKSGIFVFEKDAWSPLVMAHDCRQVVLSGANLILITSRQILEHQFLSQQSDNSQVVSSTKNLLKSFDDEPVISEVHKMAIAYAEVGNEKINDWRKKAGIKAIMPTFSLGYNSNVYGSSKGDFAVGPNDWDFNVSWDLSDLVYNDAQTSIDVRSKLMVQLRNDILSEVTRLYFERRKLQIELLSNSEISSKAKLEKELRLMELTALLDRLTGGNYSRVLKSVN
ncbi:MAG: hypothetical protein AAB213_00975 [Candidatus Omnitrophota bacterium]